jgi:2-polyprenyl-6-methoxyphenol hydroxylase-like FAD-dependent oxidoreductase
MYDAIVVGARCAGASTARLLARAGHKVLLLDRVRFPRDIPHGHLIHKDGPARLAHWGILDRLAARDCPPITTFTLDVGDGPLTGRDLAAAGVAFAYAPRRAILDQALVDAAVAAGVEFRDGCPVDELLFDAGAVRGVRGRTPNGAVMTEQARITIGADGRRSMVASAVRAPEYEAFPTVTCWYFSYWSGVADDGLEVHARGDHMIFAFPTSAGAFGIFVAWPADRLARVRADVEGEFMRAIDGVPSLAARVRAGRREERFYGATDLPNFFRTPFGKGWALVGDAGYHKDPYLALGMSDAFRDADFLAEAVTEGFSGRRDPDAALAAWEERRNAAVREEYYQNLQGARFAPPPPQMLDARARVRGNQDATNRFFLMREGRLSSPATKSTA